MSLVGQILEVIDTDLGIVKYQIALMISKIKEEDDNQYELVLWNGCADI